jgi:hypothetical protein
MRNKRLPNFTAYTVTEEKLNQYRAVAAEIPTAPAKRLQTALAAYDTTRALVGHCRAVEDMGMSASGNATAMAGAELGARARDTKRLATVPTDLRTAVAEAVEAHRLAVIDTDIAVQAAKVATNAIGPALSAWGLDGFVWAATQRAHLGPEGELAAPIMWMASRAPRNIRVPEEAALVPGGGPDISRDLRGLAGAVALRYEDNPEAHRRIDVVNGRWQYVAQTDEYRRAYYAYHHRTIVHYWAMCALAAGQYRTATGVGLIITADYGDRAALMAEYAPKPTAPLLMA